MEVIRCIVKCFADDTRNSIKVRTNDKKPLQDQNKIYKWPEKNTMKNAEI